MTPRAATPLEPKVLGYVNEPSINGTRIVGIRLSEADACYPHMHAIIDELKRRWEAGARAPSSPLVGELREALTRLIDNVETGSYESTGQAIDEARSAIVRAKEKS